MLLTCTAVTVFSFDALIRQLLIVGDKYFPDSRSLLTIRLFNSLQINAKLFSTTNSLVLRNGNCIKSNNVSQPLYLNSFRNMGSNFHSFLEGSTQSELVYVVVCGVRVFWMMCSEICNGIPPIRARFLFSSSGGAGCPYWYPAGGGGMAGLP